MQEVFAREQAYCQRSPSCSNVVLSKLTVHGLRQRCQCTRPQRRCRYDDAGHSQSRTHSPRGEAHGAHEARLGGHRLVRRCEGRPRSDASASLGARPGAGTRSRPCHRAALPLARTPGTATRLPVKAHREGPPAVVEVSDGRARQGAGGVRSPASSPSVDELACTPVVDEGIALPQACLGNGPHSQQRALLRWRACRWRRRSEGKGRFSGPSSFLARSQRTETPNGLKHTWEALFVVQLLASARLYASSPQPEGMAWNVGILTKQKNQLVVKRTRSEIGKGAQWKLSD